MGVFRNPTYPQPDRTAVAALFPATGTQELAGAAAADSAAAAALTQAAAAAQPLTGSAASASAASGALSQVATGTQPLSGGAASASAAAGALTQAAAAAHPLTGSAASVSAASGALTNSVAEVANWQIGVNTAGTGGNDMSPAAVRDSGGRLWRAAFTFAAFANSGGANNGNTLRMFRCNTTGVASAFTEQDSAHRPTNVGSFSMAIDGADTIHVAYVATYTAATTGIYYVTFDTGTNLWGTPVKIGTVNYPATTTYSVGDAGVCLALDASGIPHVVHYGQTSGTGATHIFYTNKVGGTWSAALQLDGATLGTNQRCMHPQCMFDSTGALHVVWMTITSNYGTTLEKCYYVKRSAAGTFGSVQTFAENLLGSIDNGPSVYVSEDDRVHVAYGLGDGANPVSQAVTGATVNNSLFYRFSTDGGATWNTTTQPAHIVSHDFALGPSGDGAGGVRVWCHSQPTTVDGLGTAIGYLQLPKGGSWAAWTQVANDANGNGYDCTVSPRREMFFHNGAKYLDIAYFDLNLPASAMLGTDPSGVVPMTGAASSASAASGALTQTPAPVQPLAGSAASASAASGALTQVAPAAQPLAGSAASASAASAALTQAPPATQPLTGSASSATAASAPFVNAAPGVDLLAGSASSASAASGALTQVAPPAQPLTGAASSATAGAAALTQVPASVVQALAGAASATSAASGALTQTAPISGLAGSASSTSAAAGALTQILASAHPLTGSAAAASSGGAVLAQVAALVHELAGTATATSSARGALSGALLVLGTATLTDAAVTTVALTDQAVTTSALADALV